MNEANMEVIVGGRKEMRRIDHVPTIRLHDWCGDILDVSMLPQPELRESEMACQTIGGQTIVIKTHD